MRRIVLFLTFIMILAGVAAAQKTVNTTASTSASQNTAVGEQIASGTQVSGQLQSSLDVQKARVGDQVLLKTTKAVKQGGKTVINKGSMLYGRVTEVARRTKSDTTSRIGVLFDRLQQGGRQVPINAVIMSVLQANASASMSDDTETNASTSTQGSTRSSSGSGSGIVGGMLPAAADLGTNVLNTTTQTVGKVANTTGQVVGNTTGAVAGSIKGLTISQSTSASAQGGSTLSLTGGNLKLDKGATFNLSVSSSTSVEKK